MRFSRVLRVVTLFVAGLLSLPLMLQAQPSGPSPQIEAAGVAGHYAKREVLIPMRDGVKLFTAIYTPKDASRSYPILLQRTPYSVMPYGENAFPENLGPSLRFQKEGFIFV